MGFETGSFELRLNIFNQLRYLNQDLDPTFTDHLGNVHRVDARNDINVNRNLYYFGGFVYDPNLIYNIIIWSSNSVATVIQGGYIGYRFDPAFTLYGGYWGIPGSRTNTRDFMWLQGRAEYGRQFLSTRIHTGDLGRG